MTDRFGHAVVPGYLLLCIVLGGSAQGVLAILVLQLLAILIIGGALLVRRQQSGGAAAKSLVVLVGFTLLLTVAQLIPLPPQLWSELPGRRFVAEAYQLSGQPLPWMPISLAPFATLESGLAMLPPLAVLAGMLCIGRTRPAWVAGAILVGGLLAVLLGVLQVGSIDAANSPWYLYERTNFGSAVGFFANSNHMAALLVICVPFLVAVVQNLREAVGSPRATSAAFICGGAGALVLLTGLALNGSMAGLLLGVPVLAFSMTLLITRGIRRSWAISVAVVVAALGCALILAPPLGSQFDVSNQTSVLTRQEMWTTTLSAIRDFLPVGSGLGTFQDLYHLYEDPLTVTRTFVVHAHNDYLELALEAGAAGVFLTVFLLGWWLWRTVTIWRDRASGSYAQAATIASGALLAHSMVDYPLRTAALSAIFSASLALMVYPRAHRDTDKVHMRAARHMSV